MMWLSDGDGNVVVCRDTGVAEPDFSSDFVCALTPADGPELPRLGDF